MSLEYDHEPVRGLPGNLPAGEHIVWQGAPEWRRLARDAFKTRWIAGYFAVLIVWSAIDGTAFGFAMTLVSAAVGLGLLYALAWLSARATVYTITNRRVVLRFGVALTKCINLPMSAIVAADVKRNSDGSGDIPVMLRGEHRLGYVQFWPHARPWQVAVPQPMLRSIAGIDEVAALLGRTLLAATRPLPEARDTTKPADTLAVAA